MKKIHSRHIAIVVGCSLFYGVLGTAYSCLSLLFAAVINDGGSFTITTSSLFWTVRMLVNALAAPLTAKLYLKTKYKSYLLILGILAASCFLPMGIYTQSYLWMFSAVTLGICNAGQWLVVASTVNNWFKKGSGTILGLCSAASGLITAIANPFVSQAIETFGWKAVAVGIGITVIASIILCALFLLFKDPHQFGLQAYGEDNLPASTNTTTIKPTHNRDTIYAKSSFVVYFIIFVIVLSGVIVTAVSSYIPTYATSLGYRLSVGAMLTSIMSVSGLISRLLAGFLCDKLGSWRTIGLTFITIAASFAVPFLTNFSVFGLAIASIGIGISYCPFSIFLPKLVSASFGDQYEVAFSRLNMTANLFGTFFTYLIGVIYESSFGYSLAFLLGIVVSIISLITAAIVPMINRAKKATVS